MKKTTEKRLEDIQKYLIEYEKAEVSELSKLFGVTPEMIRRDLTFLEEKGFLFRTHGGALLRDSYADIPISIRAKEKIEIKKKICNKALELISNDNCIFIDPSSTSLSLGYLIRLRKNITLVTNCFDLIKTAADCGHNIFFLGGKYSRTGNRTEGQFQLSMIEKFKFDVAFFGTDGLLDLPGPGTQSYDAIFLNDEVLKKTKLKVLLTDSSKFAITSKYCYATYNDFDVLITDYVPPEFKKIIQIPIIIEINK